MRVPYSSGGTWVALSLEAREIRGNLGHPARMGLHTRNFNVSDNLHFYIIFLV